MELTRWPPMPTTQSPATIPARAAGPPGVVAPMSMPLRAYGFGTIPS